MFRSPFLTFVFYFGLLSYVEGAPSPSPILFIPGLLSSPLNVQDFSNTTCNTNKDVYNIWINKTLISTAPECFTSQLALNYSANYSDAMDVSITAANFGSFPSFNMFLSDFLKYFLDRGYTTDVDIRMATYDWRLSPEQLKQRGFYSALKQLIQTMYDQNSNTRVTLVVHSMGGPVSLYFLTRIVSQEWKDTYIHSYIPLAGAWSGGNRIVSDLLSGPPETNGFIEMQVGSLELRSLFRTFPSFYLLLARASVWNDTVLVITPTQNYTARDFEQLFADADYPQGYTQFSEIDMEFPAPNVPTYCFYGLGIPTPMSFVYDDRFPDAQPTVINGDGDDAVNKPSSEVCLRWANSGYSFNRTVFQGVTHSGILVDHSVLQAIGSIVGAPGNPINCAQLLSVLKPLHHVWMLLSVTIFYMIY